MVPTLSSSEKLNADWILTLALFGSEFESSADSQATDIILEGQEPVLPRAAKMTFIVPKGGLEEASLQVLNMSGLPSHWNDAKAASAFPLGPTGPNGLTNSYRLL